MHVVGSFMTWTYMAAFGMRLMELMFIDDVTLHSNNRMISDKHKNEFSEKCIQLNCEELHHAAK